MKITKFTALSLLLITIFSTLVDCANISVIFYDTEINFLSAILSGGGDFA